MEALKGYREDVKSICITFWLFGYDIRVYADLKAEELLDTVNKLAKEDLKNYNSLVVFVLSHRGLVKQVNINQASQYQPIAMAFPCTELSRFTRQTENFLHTAGSTTSYAKDKIRK